jgi:environmental stress-induced protein Ves
MIQVLNENQFIRMPWKNGGGETLELYKEELYGKIQFRLSIATVKSSGPFSLFPELNRFITLLEGNGFELHFDSKKEVLNQPLQWLSFDGNDNVQCDLIEGQCLDFNVMVSKHAHTVLVSGFVSAENKTVHLTSTFVYHHRTQTLYKLEIKDTLDLELQKNDLVIEIVRG